ncbi:FAD binding domain-containing protein [Isachenkonia alkalipeptolytica]|uniref:Xanthine dehydrogenase family protein subunit M n=1 Tax=Isachenkonia alkalipeptolytica TaxID=2565777 RepID=A0AA44BFV3_9CLOT|nr:xanthine dehydrogenase family protein subunit M [Isachenkonia alkalipeptolytica]NBG89250.1 xanthine dehydrogenase family protein subunit M [Isachenkonia alkalipeptolytica]
MKSFEYFKVKTVAEAIDRLKENPDGSHILNGGTDLVLRMRENHLHPDRIIDIRGIEELKEIRFSKEEGLFVGACVPLGEMAHHKSVVEHYSLLADAAELVGSGQIRNVATMAGNLCNASPLADTATPALVLKAVMIVEGSNGEKEIPVNEFFKGVRRTALEKTDVVKGVRIPYEEGLQGSFQKASRRKDVDLSTVCASGVKIGDEYRFALGAVAPTPLRLPKVESFLKGKEINEDTIKQALDLIDDEISPIDDVRSTKEFRVHLAKTLVQRCLEQMA